MHLNSSTARHQDRIVPQGENVTGMLAKLPSSIPSLRDPGGLPHKTDRREPSNASALFQRLLIPIGPQFDCHPPSCPILDLVRTWKSEVVLLSTGDSRLHPQANSAELEKLVEQLKSAGSPRVQTISSANLPSLAIEQAARECGSSLVIMSPTLHESPAPWFGTVLQRLIRRPPVPLLVMKTHRPLAPHAILCVVEESEPSLRAVRLSATLARWIPARLTLLTVSPSVASRQVDETTVWDFYSRQRDARSLAPLPSLNPPIRNEDTTHSSAGQEAAFLGQILNECDLDGLDYEARIAEGSPAVQVALHARTRQCGLIVAGAAPRCGFTFGSPCTTAETIAEASDLPVLIVP